MHQSWAESSAQDMIAGERIMQDRIEWWIEWAHAWADFARRRPWDW